MKFVPEYESVVLELLEQQYPDEDGGHFVLLTEAEHRPWLQQLNGKLGIHTFFLALYESNTGAVVFLSDRPDWEGWDSGVELTGVGVLTFCAAVIPTPSGPAMRMGHLNTSGHHELTYDVTKVMAPDHARQSLS